MECLLCRNYDKYDLKEIYAHEQLNTRMAQTFIVESVIDSRATVREKRTGAKLFAIKWASGETTLEPLRCLIDANTHLADIVPTLKWYQRSAVLSPNKRRHCLTCNNTTVPGSLFCRRRKICKNYVKYVGIILS